MPHYRATQFVQGWTQRCEPRAPSYARAAGSGHCASGGMELRGDRPVRRARLGGFAPGGVMTELQSVGRRGPGPRIEGC